MTTLYLFVGYPGAGKTTVANYICEATGAVHIWADRERQKMFGEPTHSAQESHKLYDALNGRTATLLREGKSVVFDTNFNFAKDRAHLRQVAKQSGAQAKIIWLTTDKELAEHRAVHDSHNKPTRLYGNMDHETFQRITGHLQPPTDDEKPIKIDGTHVTKESVLLAVGLT
jgi:predicted kinase